MTHYHMMNNPIFLVGEVIRSERLMGKIQFAHAYEGTWFYIIEQAVPSHRFSFEQIQETDVVYVYRDNRWMSKNAYNEKISYVIADSYRVK